METSSRSVAAALALSALVISVLWASPAAGETESVRVTNFPKVQPISGSIEIEKPAPATHLTRISEEVVAPADPAEAINLVPAGTLEADGFRSAVFSLAGQIKSNYPGSGAVGAMLVPNTSFFRQAFEEDGEVLLSIRLEAAVDSEGGTYFAISQPEQLLAFPSYRIYFFNTTERPASVHLYAHLAN